MMRLFLFLSLLSTGVMAHATQQDYQHKHGTGQLSMVFSGAEFSLSLTVPSADIVGFESQAETDEDRAKVAVAISDLSKPLELFVLAEDAGCFTASANVALTSEGIVDQAQVAESGNGPDEDAEHSEFRADYVIQCRDIAALTTIEFAYFSRFERAQSLAISIALPDSSHEFEVTRATPLIDLTGL